MSRVRCSSRSGGGRPSADAGNVPDHRRACLPSIGCSCQWKSLIAVGPPCGKNKMEVFALMESGIEGITSSVAPLKGSGYVVCLPPRPSAYGVFAVVRPLFMAIRLLRLPQPCCHGFVFERYTVACHWRGRRIPGEQFIETNSAPLYLASSVIIGPRRNMSPLRSNRKNDPDEPAGYQFGFAQGTVGLIDAVALMRLTSLGAYPLTDTTEARYGEIAD